jgi:hypothetical protein
VDLKGQEGVPVQVVAGIAFGVFVVTWSVSPSRSWTLPGVCKLTWSLQAVLLIFLESFRPLFVSTTSPLCRYTFSFFHLSPSAASL